MIPRTIGCLMVSLLVAGGAVAAYGGEADGALVAGETCTFAQTAEPVSVVVRLAAGRGYVVRLRNVAEAGDLLPPGRAIVSLSRADGSFIFAATRDGAVLRPPASGDFTLTVDPDDSNPADGVLLEEARDDAAGQSKGATPRLEGARTIDVPFGVLAGERVTLSASVRGRRRSSAVLVSPGGVESRVTLPRRSLLLGESGTWTLRLDRVRGAWRVRHALEGPAASAVTLVPAAALRPVPALAGVTPDLADTGDLVPFTITGAGFTRGSSLRLHPVGGSGDVVIAAGAVVPQSAETALAVMDLAGVAPGVYGASVKSDAGSAGASFAVAAAFRVTVLPAGRHPEIVTPWFGAQSHDPVTGQVPVIDVVVRDVRTDVPPRLVSARGVEFVPSVTSLGDGTFRLSAPLPPGSGGLFGLLVTTQTGDTRYIAGAGEVLGPTEPAQVLTGPDLEGLSGVALAVDRQSGVALVSTYRGDDRVLVLHDPASGAAPPVIDTDAQGPRRGGDRLAWNPVRRTWGQVVDSMYIPIADSFAWRGVRTRELDGRTLDVVGPTQWHGRESIWSSVDSLGADGEKGFRLIVHQVATSDRCKTLVEFGGAASAGRPTGNLWLGSTYSCTHEFFPLPTAFVYETDASSRRLSAVPTHEPGIEEWLVFGFPTGAAGGGLTVISGSPSRGFHADSDGDAICLATSTGPAAPVVIVLHSGGATSSELLPAGAGDSATLRGDVLGTVWNAQRDEFVIAVRLEQPAPSGGARFGLIRVARDGRVLDLPVDEIFGTDRVVHDVKIAACEGGRFLLAADEEVAGRRAITLYRMR